MKQARNETHSKRRGIQKPDLIRQQRSEPLINPDILSQAAIDADADVALDADAVLAVRLVGTGAIVADAAGAEREAAHDAVAGPEGRDGCADGGHGARALVRGGLGQPAGAEDAGAHHAVRVAVGGYRYLDDDVVGAGWGRDRHPVRSWYGSLKAVTWTALIVSGRSDAVVMLMVGEREPCCVQVRENVNDILNREGVLLLVGKGRLNTKNQFV